jgi:fused signal recognition particle receptor
MLGLSSIKKLFGGPCDARKIDAFAQALGGGGRIDEERLEALEEALISADVGTPVAASVVEAVRVSARAKGGEIAEEDLHALVAAELTRLLESGAAQAPSTPAAVRGPSAARDAAGSAASGTGPVQAGGAAPRVVLVVGVNGGGKTTTVAKLAARLRGEGRSVLLAAADTFRAAATEQLVIWGERAGVPVIAHASGADPGAVVFDAARAALGRRSDVLLVDTAGRLHTKSNLMQELEKIARIAAREVPGAPHEVLLVLDATTGQNGLAQAREFTRSVPVTGLVVTKLDGTARGGVALAIARELGVPIRYIGVGEGMDDLLDFDPRAFVESLLGSAAGADARRAGRAGTPAPRGER